MGFSGVGHYRGHFGFGGVAVAAAGIAKVLFFIFIALFVIGLLTGRRTI